MRLWSIHPKYLDRIGLIALWRESLLAQKVLEGKTSGYVSHPQLIRFKEHERPVSAIGYYLTQILLEAKRRGYDFDRKKISRPGLEEGILEISSGQLAYEFGHIKKKCGRRDPDCLKRIERIKSIEANPIFKTVDGGVKAWERVRR